MGRGRKWLAALVDVGDLKSAAGRALVQERYRALQRQIPLLYIILLANFMGLYLATGGETAGLTSPGLPFASARVASAAAPAAVRNTRLSK